MQNDKKLQRAFGLAVRRARERLDVSQDKLAELANLHRTYIGSVERGERNISLVNIAGLARALKTTPTKLMAACEACLKSLQPRRGQ
ncbi:MAG TPA: helix-turn-helix transcriptional regulator [Verrucomicrobiota bacterium]|nr:helix-turn-helix transcriptional regulator [Verrucomicrobiota bacterium]HNT14017.1 helix-turn-helix transcriptional regulator [Verrucomicrobiota bacterium]